MKKLSNDWFIEGLLDAEYKKYLLLAYLQHVSREFAEVRLYPAFSDLIFHYRNLFQFKSNKQKLYEQFPSKLDEEALKQFNLMATKEIEDGEQLKQIEEIIEYSLPAINQYLKEGKEIYEFIEEQLSIEPVGILPLYKKEGYVLIRVDKESEVKAFEYKIVFFENTDANYHGISLQHITTFPFSLAHTYEAMKMSLIRNIGKLPNPATYLLNARYRYPEESTLLPVVKRKLLRYLK